MPIPGNGFKREVFVGGEVPFYDAEPDYRQHDCADRNVHAMKTGQHEERRTIDAGRHLEVVVLVGLDVLSALQVDKHETKQEGHREKRRQYFALARYKRVMCDRDGDAAGQQDRGIDQR